MDFVMLYNMTILIMRWFWLNNIILQKPAHGSLTFTLNILNKNVSNKNCKAENSAYFLYFVNAEIKLKANKQTNVWRSIRQIMWLFVIDVCVVNINFKIPLLL